MWGGWKEAVDQKKKLSFSSNAEWKSFPKTRFEKVGDARSEQMSRLLHCGKPGPIESKKPLEERVQERRRQRARSPTHQETGDMGFLFGRVNAFYFPFYFVFPRTTYTRTTGTSPTQTRPYRRTPPRSHLPDLPLFRPKFPTSDSLPSHPPYSSPFLSRLAHFV